MSDAAVQQLQAQVTDLTAKVTALTNTVTAQGEEIKQLKQSADANASAISSFKHLGL
ncbi:hypothetical protein [Acinetobacter baumannii]|uniref:hypothetical protein n=1 Tax=Acinetobacter baumannii TaxID=470 RepID=UPI0023EF8902|nr:hypothetical protein [Acinetobacter baumannii]MDF7837064.1 hypothetical protein [Acinetobacter baumannii]